jgi:hypothetical protein
VVTVAGAFFAVAGAGVTVAGAVLICSRIQTVAVAVAETVAVGEAVTVAVVSSCNSQQ